MSINIINNAVITFENSDMIFIEYQKVESENSDNHSIQIATNTEQTWQPTRGFTETLQNTVQGKTAEEIFETYISINYPHFNLLSYDEIRNDNFEKHAPFDFLIWKGNQEITEIIESIHEDITNSSRFVSISPRTKRLCSQNKVKIVEVKSTKIADRHKNSIGFCDDDYANIDKIIKLAEELEADDFLAYPRYIRKTDDKNFDENAYIEFLSNKGYAFTNRNEMLTFEKRNQLCDAMVRVYLDEDNNTAFLVGWIDKDSFYQSATLKRMRQPRKSELAIYFAVSLRARRNIEDFDTFLD